ncbi:DUF6541 family protein [uncultured Corynebacterium sp.]|uniref:DUF6541 family protein n=1 Tax=uncultured Corynebacterium sp. TaxID=159447 RepID=UPI0025E9CEF2|nr:DUF6541 family protein [uncultured Corynebacterium sp.]
MFAAAVVTALLLLLPGTITGLAAGLRPMAAVASAGPIGLGIAGFAAWAAGELDIRWGWWAFLTAWAAASALAFLCARFIPRANSVRRGSRSVGATVGAPRVTGPGTRSWFAPSPGEWVTAAVAAAVSLVASVRYLLPLRDLPGGGSNLRQAWDMQWHNNFLRWAAEEGVASPTRAGELMNRETAEPMFYPAAWHALGSLIPGDPILQGNVFGAVAPVVVLPAGAAFLAWIVAGPRWAVVAAPSAAIASIVLPEITGSLMITGSLPYLLAVAAIPATMALLITGRTVAAVPALIGTFLAHPAAAVAVAVFTLTWFLTRPRLAMLARLLVTALLTAALLAPSLVAAATAGESVAAYTGQIGLERGESLWWTVTGQSNHTQAIGWYPPAVVLAVLGAIVLLFRRRPWTPWPVLSLLILGVVSDSAQARWMDPFGEWFKLLGTFFYDMAYRLQAPMGILRLVCIGVAVAFLADLLRRLASMVRHRRSRSTDVRDDASVPGFAGPDPDARGGVVTPSRRRRATAAILVGATSAAALVPVAWATGDEARYSILRSRGTQLVTPDDARAMEWLARQPHAKTGHVLVNPSEGSGWMYALEGLPSLFTHFPWPDPDSEKTEDAFHDLDLAGTGRPGNPNVANDTDIALRDLGIRYVFVSPPSAGAAGGAALATRSWAWWSPGVTPVYQDGSATIFAVDDMLTDAELDAVIDDSPHPPRPADPAKNPPRQPIIAPAGETTSPLAGAVVGVRSGTDGNAAATDADLDEELLLADDRTGDAVADALADSVAAELRRRGATVVELDGTGATGVSGLDAVVDVGMESAGAGNTGFRVTGLYPGRSGEGSWDTARMAGGVRDALVLQGFTPGNRYDDEGAVDGVADGLAPAFGIDGAAVPEIIVSPGNVDDADELKNMRTKRWRDKAAGGVADGISAMLRERGVS